MTPLNQLEIYRRAMVIGERVWAIVLGWDSFAKQTLGKQLVNAADSIANNISEGYGRFYYRDKKLFYYYARGSMFETATELVKAKQRALISLDEFDMIKDELRILLPKLNAFIKSTGNKPNLKAESRKPNDQ